MLRVRTENGKSRLTWKGPVQPAAMKVREEVETVIGDGEAIPDGEVDGLGAEDLLALYRDMVVLRTYDERSLVYHRQGRIGTYAISWGHECTRGRRLDLSVVP